MKTKYLTTGYPGVLLIIFIVSALLLAGMIATADDKADSGVFRIRDENTISFRRMIGEIKKTDLIFVGELHNSPEHHRMELEVIRALHEAGVPVAVGIEMFRKDSQKELDAWVRGTLSVDEFLPVYYDNWREPWPLYRDIFVYARDHGIPLIGLNISDLISETIAQKGFEALNKEQKKQLPPGISCDVDPTYMAFIRRAYAQHARGREKRFINFCEAQMVWDKAMAWHLIEYRKKHPGDTVVVLAGIGHAWKRGIPEQVARMSKIAFRSVLPVIPTQVDPDTVTEQDADYVLFQ